MAKLGTKQKRKIHIQDDEVNISDDGMSYHMIAKIFNLSVQDVKIIERSAIRKLQIPNQKNKKLREYLKMSVSPDESSERGL